MIATTVAMHDIRDAEGFCAYTIRKSRIRLTPDQHEELLAEGLCILAELAAKYDHQRDGYAQAGTFSGYAGMLLPKRLDDAWHRMNPHHHSVRDEAGKRRWEYGHQAMSLQQEDMPELVATAFAPHDSYVIVDEAIGRMDPWDRSCARRIVTLLDEGHGTDEIARDLGLGRKATTRLQGSIGSAIYEVQQGARAA